MSQLETPTRVIINYALFLVMGIITGLMAAHMASRTYVDNTGYPIATFRKHSDSLMLVISHDPDMQDTRSQTWNGNCITTHVKDWEDYSQLREKLIQAR